MNKYYYNRFDDLCYYTHLIVLKSKDMPFTRSQGLLEYLNGGERRKYLCPLEPFVENREKQLERFYVAKKWSFVYTVEDRLEQLVSVNIDTQQAGEVGLCCFIESLNASFGFDKFDRRKANKRKKYYYNIMGNICCRFEKNNFFRSEDIPFNMSESLLEYLNKGERRKYICPLAPFVEQRKEQLERFYNSDRTSVIVDRNNALKSLVLNSYYSRKEMLDLVKSLNKEFGYQVKDRREKSHLY